MSPCLTDNCISLMFMSIHIMWWKVVTCFAFIFEYSTYKADIFSICIAFICSGIPRSIASWRILKVLEKVNSVLRRSLKLGSFTELFKPLDSPLPTVKAHFDTRYQTHSGTRHNVYYVYYWVHTSNTNIGYTGEECPVVIYPASMFTFNMESILPENIDITPWDILFSFIHALQFWLVNNDHLLLSDA